MRKLDFIVIMVLHAFMIINWIPFFLKISRFRVTTANYKKDGFFLFQTFQFYPRARRF